MGTGELTYDISQICIHKASSSLHQAPYLRRQRRLTRPYKKRCLGDRRLGPSLPQPPRSPSSSGDLTHHEEYYGSQGLGIVRYFHANERSEDAELGVVARNIGDHIYRYFPQAAVLLLDNKKLQGLSKGKDGSPTMQLYTRDASRNWKLTGPDGGSRLIIKESAANTVLLDYIVTEKCRML